MLDILEVTPADKDAIIDLFYTEKMTWPWSVKKQWYRYWHSRGKTEQWHKAVRDGHIVGSVHWAIRLDNTRTIHDIVTAPNVRRQGIGRALVNFIGRPITLKTDIDSLSQNFYLRLGFIQRQPVLSRDSTRLVSVFYLPKDQMTIPDSPWILTYTGKVVNPLAIKPSDVCIEDLAHALACVNRFAGHTVKPISVAQHCVYVSRLCDDTPHAMQALLHDGSEAYLGDVTKFVKESDSFSLYRRAECIAQTAIYSKFGVSSVVAPEVERADQVMVMYEAPRGFGTAWSNAHLPYAPITEDELERIGKWTAWSWRQSEEAFLVRYRCLSTK